VSKIMNVRIMFMKSGKNDVVKKMPNDLPFKKKFQETNITTGE